MSSSKALRLLPPRLLIAILAMGGGAALFWYDPAGFSVFPVCLFHQTTGLLCPGCGSLRAMHQLLHGHLLLAFRFNPLLLVLLPLAGWYAAVYASKNLCHLSFGEASAPERPARTLWILLFLVVALAFAVWRNLPGFPIPMPP